MPVLKQGMLFANRYQLKKYIGVGGYSEVWLAEDTYAGSLTVALKVFAAGNGLDEKGLDVFSKEYSLVFDLRNEHLLIPKHFDICNNSPYLVLPYCRNGSALGKAGEMSENDMALFMHQAAAALDFLHTRQPPIIHQDIKPDNFLIDDEGNYLLADFGISSRIRRTLTRSMGDKSSPGTLAFMPPEKWDKKKQTLPAGDIFSLGAAMYELLTGELPFGDMGGLAMRNGAEIPDLPNEFSAELNNILKQCMAFDPEERLSAEKLRNVASGFLENGKWDINETHLKKNKKYDQLMPESKSSLIFGVISVCLTCLFWITIFMAKDSHQSLSYIYSEGLNLSRKVFGSSLHLKPMDITLTVCSNIIIISLCILAIGKGVKALNMNRKISFANHHANRVMSGTGLFIGLTGIVITLLLLLYAGFF